MMTVTLKDALKQVTTYYYRIVYTNTAPYFIGTPSTSITTSFSKEVAVPLPTI
jgi:hypothetical protein